MFGWPILQVNSIKLPVLNFTIVIWDPLIFKLDFCKYFLNYCKDGNSVDLPQKPFYTFLLLIRPYLKNYKLFLHYNKPD